MTNQNNIEFAKLFTESKKKAIRNITKCYHPDCNEKSINSHIFQKNGILSSIALDNHLWQPEIHQFSNQSLQIKRRGIDQAFSFNCFCKKHDDELFQRIEKHSIDFDDYLSCLLFTLRSIYNEIFRKEVNIGMYKLFLKQNSIELSKSVIHTYLNQEELGVDDLSGIAANIWGDVNTSDCSFIFRTRKIQRIELCLSSFYNFDTSREMNLYKFNTGKDLPRITHIFINLFPFKDHSILLMGYEKRDESKVKGYFGSFFEESEKRLIRKLTNLVLFQCETWAASDDFYKKNIKDVEYLYDEAISFSLKSQNERRVHDVSFNDHNFKDKLIRILK